MFIRFIDYVFASHQISRLLTTQFGIFFALEKISNTVISRRRQQGAVPCGLLSWVKQTGCGQPGRSGARLACPATPA